MHSAGVGPNHQSEIACSLRQVYAKERKTSERDEEVMVSQKLPHVSVGLPVYNGERYSGRLSIDFVANLSGSRTDYQ